MDLYMREPVLYNQRYGRHYQRGNHKTVYAKARIRQDHRQQHRHKSFHYTNKGKHFKVEIYAQFGEWNYTQRIHWRSESVKRYQYKNVMIMIHPAANKP